MFLRQLSARFWHQLWHWWHGRSFRLILQGLPALVLGFSMAGVSLLANLAPQQELDANYLLQARHAFKVHDYPTALICYDRLAPRAESRPDILFGLAQTAQALGRIDQTLALMQQLAPFDQKGYGEAHLWWGWHLMTQTRMTEQSRQIAEKHLLVALEGELEDRSRVHCLLGELYLSNGQLDRAEMYLTRVIQLRPHLRLRLAQLHAQRGHKDRARSEAQLVVNFYRPRAQGDPNQHFARLAWADATTFLEEFPQAVAILTEGLSSSKSSLYTEALGRAYLAWHDFLAHRTTPDQALQLSVLEKGLENDPKNKDLLNRLSALTRLTSAESDRARAMLQELVARGEGSAAAHFALAAGAWQRGQQEQARVHMERAFEIAPHLPVVANNLAWTLAHLPNPDLPRALDLINAALAQAPKNSQFRDTRGRILAKMGQWPEALADLEAGLADRKEGSELHLLLAVAYEKTGLPEMAAAHRRLAPTNHRGPDGPAPTKRN